MMSEKKSAVMHKTRPFYGRIMCIDSPVDESQLESGLIVPLKLDDSVLTRAIVIHHDKHFTEHSSDQSYPYTDLIPVGTVIWYLVGKVIGDVVIVDVDDIYAYEED